MSANAAALLTTSFLAASPAAARRASVASTILTAVADTAPAPRAAWRPFVLMGAYLDTSASAGPSRRGRPVRGGYAG